MTKTNYLSVLLSTVICFLLGAFYYTIFGAELSKYSTPVVEQQEVFPSMVVELIRCFILSVVLVILVNITNSNNWKEGFKLGLLLWLGFPLVLWMGAIAHENTPIMLAIIHSGDWLLKLIVLTVILSFRNRKK
ncbi:DUF1761 domain-containing protein [Arenibacter sp. BSSL-BM3]|uniref:DUF1761 domain-containing protein n=1 Tax=Arenibacter arenosicollis TaxID=2762274 RepID=A0ABR7QTL3_9FLAO|nr:DUF1761 domain-containing protein [Arenibacter arenosicollis]MBC8770414.1 DUF1761 domain-containing protein [Arenibacter arenosicollis]